MVEDEGKLCLWRPQTQRQDLQSEVELHISTVAYCGGGGHNAAPWVVVLSWRLHADM